MSQSELRVSSRPRLRVCRTLKVMVCLRWSKSQNYSFCSAQITKYIHRAKTNKKLLLDDEENKVDKCFTNRLEVYMNESGFDPEEETLTSEQSLAKAVLNKARHPREGTRWKLILSDIYYYMQSNYYDSNSVFLFIV